MTQLDAGLLEVLGDLERTEARLLAWGVVDSAMSEDEILERIEDSCKRHHVDELPDNVLEALLEQRLVFEVEDVEDGGFRTRMGEAVRLFARLRQWVHGRSWLAAPTLVADFRFDLRPRAYPRRNIAPADAVEALAPSPDSTRRQGLEALISSHGEHKDRDLARFQVDAAERILRGLALNRAGGTIITAGTGSGKTLAFYLPTLSWLAEEIDETHATRVIAIYPRNELLKDQLVQCLAELDRLGEIGTRPIRIGALFGPTPTERKWVEEGRTPWPVHAAGGRRCPYIYCPRCHSPLIWADADRHASSERLHCVSCTYSADEPQFAITRDGIRERPPDLLFTTTEMLNRLSSNVRFAHVLGMRGPRPRLMLLDEVHTYGGPSGAHVAHLIRRWHHAVGRRVQFVGLSATLRDAPGFLARLTGLRDDAVREITPARDSLEHRGMEYMLALRGNPMSSTALLSTTIQALMLGARILDPPASGDGGVAGSRVFAFTDKLDLANRLFHFYSDAEGWGPYERPLNRSSLATLRGPGSTDGDRQLARRAGQVWDMPAEIGHDLVSGRKRVGITTSQRAGVQEREVIVATAALEVGYNDEQVGLVLQHKAPRDPAAFIQRRGRAGRRQEQRPWTLVVLSDFGRDRIAYQSYERLFDPELPARSLPIANNAVRRMQAAYATLDWLATQRAHGYSVWDDLTKPGYAPAQRALAEAIERTLRDRDIRRKLEDHLSRALGLDREETQALLWSPPRGILTEMLPTALRRLRSGWFHAVKGPEQDLQAPNSPLPEFMPPNLFTDLQLPEVTVTVPPQRRSEAPANEELPVFLALTEFAPGNVSFRYALEGRWAASWVPPGPTHAPSLDIETFCVSQDDLGDVIDAGVTRRLFRPWHVRTERRPPAVLDSSRGSLRWGGGPLPEEPGIHIDLPEASTWERTLRRVEAHLHAAQQFIKVRRYATGFDADVGYQSGQREQFGRDFAFQEKPAALGFEYEADALAFHVEIPEHDILPGGDQPERLRGFRAAWFSSSVQHEPSLFGVASIFQREQLERAYLACVTDEALRRKIDLRAARDGIGTRIHDRLVDAIDALFATADMFGGPERGLDELKALAREAGVINALDRASGALWAPLDATAAEWASQRFASTVAAAISDAAQAVCPEFDVESEVVVDVIEASPSSRTIWLVESSPGGGGLVETLQRRMVERPRHFVSLLDRATRPSDFEVVDGALTAVLLEAKDRESALAQRFASFREATSNDQRLDSLHAIRRELDRLELPSSHPVIAALAARVVRHGSNEATDAALALLSERWGEAERALGVELEPSVFAYSQRESGDYDALLGTGGSGNVELRRIGAISSSLWARGWRARAEGLRAYSPFTEFPPTDRLALERFRSAAAPGIDVTAPDWRNLVDDQVRRHGMAVIEAPNRQAIAEAIRALTVEPTDTGSLLLHPIVAGVDRVGGQIRAMVLLDEGFAP
jgi:hypothetical protein